MAEMSLRQINDDAVALLHSLRGQDGRLEAFSNRGVPIGDGWERDLTVDAKKLARISRSIDDYMPGQNWGQTLGDDALTLARKGARLHALSETGTRFASWGTTLDEPIRHLDDLLHAIAMIR